MILFTILTMIAIALICAAVFTLAIGGTLFFTIFADFIVCAFIIYLIIKFIF